MSRHRDEHLDLCAAEVLGVLDPAGRAELEAHLAGGCEVCEAELRALSGGATVLALSVPQLHAPPAARARVLEAVRAE
ncbi:MAG TPA: anti-sigma factor, partial [Candidatus Eisenbacteria bacterium]